MGKSKELAELGDVVTQSGGKVGVNVTNPPYDFYVKQRGNSYSFGLEADTDDTRLLMGEFNNQWRITATYGSNGSFMPLSFWTSDVERVAIDTAGRVTMPYQPAFMARNGAGFNTNGYLNSFTNIDFNIGGHFNNSSGLFTAPISGRYLIMAGILVEAGSGRLEFRLNYNGGYHILGNGTGTTYDGPTVSGIIQMSAGDYVRVDRVSGTAHGDGNHGNTYFGGYLLG